VSALKQKVYSLLEPAPDDPPVEKVVNVALFSLIALNVVAVVLETVPDLGAQYGPAFRLFDDVSVLIFSLELALRVWSCPSEPRYAGPGGRMRFLRTPLAVVDVLAILPWYLPWAMAVDGRMLRMLRLVRLLRIFKLARYSEALRTLGSIVRARSADLGITAMFGTMLLLGSSSIMYAIERDVQPEAFSSIPAAMWWGCVTLTTVGYGDVYPVTPLGRMAGAVIQIVGVGLFALPAGILAGGFASHLEERARAARKKPSCPHCGGELE
jgi:voltage-gated potassium channel